MKMNDRNIGLELWRRLHIDLWLFIGLVVITGYGILVCWYCIVHPVQMRRCFITALYRLGLVLPLC